MAQLRPKIVKLAKIIGGVTGITTKIDENAPEYYCMAGILSDDEADIAIAAGLRKERTAGYLAKKVGKTVEEIAPLLDNLATTASSAARWTRRSARTCITCRSSRPASSR